MLPGRIGSVGPACALFYSIGFALAVYWCILRRRRAAFLLFFAYQLGALTVIGATALFLFLTSVWRLLHHDAVAASVLSHKYFE